MDQRVDNERRAEFRAQPGSEARCRRGAEEALAGSRRSAQRRGSWRSPSSSVSHRRSWRLSLWWLHARQYESTDDAFIDARTVQISAQVAAAIVDVPVTDNQMVEAGAVLVRLDDRDYQLVDQARARSSRRSRHRQSRSPRSPRSRRGSTRPTSRSTQAQAALTFAQQEADRYQQLAKQGTATVEQAQQYSSNLLQSQGVVRRGAGQRRRHREAECRARGAAGIPSAVTQRTLPRTGRGQSVAHRHHRAGRRPRDAAHRRERRLRRGRPGADDVRAARGLGDGQFQGDAARPHAARAARRSSRSTPIPTAPSRATSTASNPAAAPRSACCRRENATGNYVKIVQRVPVKIVFDKPPDVLLGPGMSVVPTVKVR